MVLILKINIKKWDYYIAFKGIMQEEQMGKQKKQCESLNNN